MLKPSIRKCKRCDKEFRPYTSKHRHCSARCYSLDRPGNIDILAAHERSSKEFDRKHSKLIQASKEYGYNYQMWPKKSKKEISA